MAATFITDMGTAIALSILFISPSLYTGIFIITAVIVIILATRYSHYLFNNPRIKGSVIEPELKFIFLLLIVFIYFANLGDGHAVLPTFLLGLFMGRYLAENEKKPRCNPQTSDRCICLYHARVFYNWWDECFLCSYHRAFGLFAMLFILKMITKFMGVYLSCV
jgi:hypothetical protein